MQYRPLAGTDLEVSVVGFGCWAIGGRWWGDDVEDSQSIAAVRKAVELGVTLFDTAPLYGNGHADEVLVQALGEYRHKVIIATKVGVDDSDPGGHAFSHLHPDFVKKDCEASLKRLGLDCIDLLQVHWPCERETPLPDTLGALEELKQAGKIRHYGLCNYDADSLASARSEVTLGSFQTPYSILRREFEAGLRGVCQSPTALGVLAYEPLCRGLLTGKFRSQPNFPDTDLRSRDDRFKGALFQRSARFVTDLSAAADRLGVPTAAVAVAWVLRQPGITSALVGAKSPEQVQQNVKASLLASTERPWAVLDQIIDTWRG